MSKQHSTVQVSQGQEEDPATDKHLQEFLRRLETEASRQADNHGEDQALSPEDTLRADTLLRMAATRIPQTPASPHLSPEAIAETKRGNPPPGAWRHCFECDECRGKVTQLSWLEGVVQAWRSAIRRFSAQFDPLPGWAITRQPALGFVVVMVLTLSWFSLRDPHSSSDAPMASWSAQQTSSELGALEVAMISDGYRAAGSGETPSASLSLDDIRRAVLDAPPRPIAPSGGLIFRLVGPPAEVLVAGAKIHLLVRPEVGGQIQVMPASIRPLERGFELQVPGGQVWPQGVPIRLTLLIGSPQGPELSLSEVSKLMKLPDALATTRTSTPGSLGGVPSHIVTDPGPLPIRCEPWGDHWVLCGLPFRLEVQP